MDTDFHPIMDSNGTLINPASPVIIGNKVWIGCRNTILKGVVIPDNVVIAANSTITKRVPEGNCIVGGHGKELNILKKDINWEK